MKARDLKIPVRSFWRGEERRFLPSPPQSSQLTYCTIYQCQSQTIGPRCLLLEFDFLIDFLLLLFFIRYFLYLHFKCYPFSQFPLQKFHIQHPQLLPNPPTPASWLWHSPILGHRTFTRPRASPPIDNQLGHPLLHMQLETWSHHVFSLIGGLVPRKSGGTG